MPTQPPRTWFVTGAGSGFGLEVTTQLLAAGQRVAATSHTLSAALKELSAQHGDRLWTAALDVTEPATVRAVVDQAFSELGRIDVVFSSAGFGALGAAEELSDELLRRQLAVNLLGPIHLTRAVTPWLRTQGGGRIIQMSSSGGHVPDPGMSVYNASKFGVEGFFESAAVELAAFGIEVTLIAPGGTRTAFNANITQAEPLAAYADGVLGQVRGALAGGMDETTLRHAVAGDPVKIARAIVASADTTPAPRRLVFGAAAYETIANAWQQRLEALAAQRELAFGTDADDVLADRANA
ncbi:SDR family oxidoreductase [Amycolatopsis rhabdoformis]|uniref:SDR family oxidoreductase n=1 Tax=Amycolatopsis rhabdoformis TaxID=1448059 RepID=A0ABZ1IB06_9PSEU|nr:SDR family oxidoreductase [Amycolatopsis rhabdoformis]WSE31595.1 SDR family oxidoreductase [Amycolatopsis rhabdoformis]